MQNNLKNYLNNLYNVYKNSSEKKSISETLLEFSQLAQTYENQNIVSKVYSSPDFFKCTKDEQEDIVNNQFQLIETLVTNSIYLTQGTIWNFAEILNLITNEQYQTVDKLARKVVYSSASSNRPIGEPAYDTWNGIQIIDLDIKNGELASKL